MPGDRISHALTRIETAANRIREAARETPASEKAEIAVRYEALRREAAAAMSEIDNLIAELEQ